VKLRGFARRLEPRRAYVQPQVSCLSGGAYLRTTGRQSV
jgi:hypothetical protein